MQHPLRYWHLLPLLILAACGEDQSPTAPMAPASNLSATATLVVNSLADPGNGVCNASQCTLREAINDPRSSAISFAPGLSGGAITLARLEDGGGTLIIGKSLTITGPAAGITIRRRSTDPDFRIVRVAEGVTAALTNLSFRGGRAPNPGGGITNFGRLTLNHCTVADNTAVGVSGGGISNEGVLTIRNGTVSNNSGQSGGGIANDHASLTLRNTTVSHNSGGGISIGGGRVALRNSQVTDNTTSFKGGGILNGGGIVTLENSTVARNSAAAGGGGISNRDNGVVTVTRSTVFANSTPAKGGGIENNPRPRQGAQLTVINSTISGNSAQSGGGIFNDAFLGGASASLTNTTVALNTASASGGGVYEGFDDSETRLTNTLVARNRSPAGPDVFSADDNSPATARSSLIGDGSGSDISNTNGNQVGTSSSPINPRIGPLTNNGGPTLTHALLAGSPAINAASLADCPATDQRGVTRPQGAGCDIGSYERR